MRKKIYKEFKLQNMLDICAKLGEIEGMTSVMRFIEDRESLEGALDDINAMAGSIATRFMAAETYIVDESHIMELPESHKLDRGP